MAQALEVLYIIIIIVYVNIEYIYIDLRHYRKSDDIWVTNITSSACGYGLTSQSKYFIYDRATIFKILTSTMDS